MSGLVMSALLPSDRDMASENGDISRSLVSHADLKRAFATLAEWGTAESRYAVAEGLQPRNICELHIMT